MLFGREPALFLGLIAAAIQIGSSTFLHLTTEQQGALNMAVAAVVAVVLAWRVSAEKGAAALIGLTQTLTAGVLAFGFELSAELQSSIMALVMAGVSFYTRTQVVAPVDEFGDRH